MRLSVIVASTGRPGEIDLLLRHLCRQTIQPKQIILSVVHLDDLPNAIDPRVRIVIGQKGLTKQRNVALEFAVASTDIVVFFDDDFLPEDTALAEIVNLFETNPDIVGASGLVLADGIKLGGLSSEQALSILDKQQNLSRPLFNKPTDALYGCNMAVRASAIQDIRFDERLPLYAWQEDVDFTGQLRHRGRIVKSSAFAGVHLGVTKGRTPGFALGFSQIINPVYLVRKGTMRPLKALILMLKNIAANHVRSIHPEPYVDRLGRVSGNWLGIWYLLHGRLDPMVILRLRSASRRKINQKII